MLDERFALAELDTTVWFPYYLPHWSSRASSAATWAVRDGALHLSIPADQPLWCADRHEEPIRVSCIQSGHLTGQQAFQSGLEVREDVPRFWGCTPHFGYIEIRMRGSMTPRSMFAFYLSGIEDRPERSGEICVAEVFGEDVHEGYADVGMGVKRFHDPALTQEFSTARLAIDVGAFHTYAVDWRPGSLVFTVDGEVVRRLGQAPDYPVQLMLGVFDFPAKGGDLHVPEMVVTHVRAAPL